VLERTGALDRATVVVERDPTISPADMNHFAADLKDRVRHKLKNDTAANFEVDILPPTHSNVRFRRQNVSKIAGRNIGRPITEQTQPTSPGACARGIHFVNGQKLERIIRERSSTSADRRGASGPDARAQIQRAPRTGTPSARPSRGSC
jgi:hypothetical protein